MPEPAKCKQWLEKNFPDVFAKLTLGKSAFFHLGPVHRHGLDKANIRP